MKTILCFLMLSLATLFVSCIDLSSTMTCCGEDGKCAESCSCCKE